MSFSLPEFNLPVNVWTYPVLPPAAPTVMAMGNLAWGRRIMPATGGTELYGMVAITLLLPAGTDIRGQAQSGHPDRAEVPAGSGRFYTVQYVDDVGKGFANEHRAALLTPIAAWPIPYP